MSIEFSVSMQKVGKGESFPLHKGALVKLNAWMPRYEVTEVDTNPAHPHLTISLIPPRNADEAHNAPLLREHQTIEIGAEPVHIGARKENDVYLNIQSISGDHAAISFDGKEFNYHHKGRFEASAIDMEAIKAAHKAWLADPQRPAAAIHLYTHDEAKEQIAHLDHLLEEVKEHRKSLNAVVQLEASIIDVNRYGELRGGKTEDSQLGYALWLNAIAEVDRDTLSASQYRDMRHMADVLTELASGRAELREIEKDPEHKIGVYDRATREQEAFHEEIEHYVDAKAQQLEDEGEVYMVSGFRRHHVISRITKSGDEYILTTYNGGAEAQNAPRVTDPDDEPEAPEVAVDAPVGPDNLKGNKVMGVVEQKLVANPEVVERSKDAKELIRLIAERKIRKHHQHGSIDGDMGRLLNPKINRYKAVKPQKYGNCTTRSTRHALQDALGDTVVQGIGEFLVSDNAVRGLQEDLEKRRDALAASIGEPALPARASDNVTTASGSADKTSSQNSQISASPDFSPSGWSLGQRQQGVDPQRGVSSVTRP